MSVTHESVHVEDCGSYVNHLIIFKETYGGQK